MVFGARGKPRDARVHHDEARPAAHEVHHRMAEQPVGVGGKRHLAPDDHALGQFECRVVVAAGKAAGIVDLGIRAADVVGRGRHARHVARIARLGIAPVARAERQAAPNAQRAALAARAGEAHHALAAVFGRDAAVVLLDDVERLVPRAALPLVGLAAVFLGTLQGVRDARRVVQVVLQREAAHAQAALRDGLVLVALHLRQLAVLVDVELQAAAHRMASGRRPRRRAGDRVARLLVPPGFSQVVDLAQCRQRHRLTRFHVAHASPFLGLPSRDPKSPLRLGTAAIMGKRHDGAHEA